MRISKFILMLFSVNAILFLTSCNDDPSSFGTELLPDSDFLNIVHVNSNDLNLPQNVSSFRDSVSTGGSSRVLLGKYGNVESWMLIKFNFVLPDSITTYLKNNQLNITGSWIELKPNYVLGDTLFNNFMFSVYRINSKWNANTITEDSLNSLDYGNTNLADNFIYTDTTIQFNFSTEVSESWLKRQVDDSQQDDNGILFVPETDGMVLGFQALTLNPKDELPTLKIVVENPGVFTDTLSATPTTDVHIVKGDLPQTAPDSFVLQDGLPVRAKFFIGLEKISANTAINRATLTFYVNTDETIQGNIKSDSLAVYIYEDSLKNKINKDYGRIILKRTFDTYTGDVTSFVQRWINGLNNEGVRINLTDETRALSKIVLYSNAVADTTKRPLLEIDYIKKK